MINTFEGMQLSFPNGGIHSVIGTAFKFRKQLTIRTEFKQQSGWNNELNIFIMQGLNELSSHVKRITYNSTTVSDLGNTNPQPPNSTANSAPVGGAGLTVDQQLKNAADLTRTLRDEFNANSPQADNLLMMPLPNRPVVHVVDGSDPDIPQPTPMQIPNDHGRLLITSLDNFITQMTRLDSRNDLTFISKYEAAMAQNMLEQMWAQAQEFGGENNRTFTPAGTLPSQEAGTFKAATTTT